MKTAATEAKIFQFEAHATEPQRLPGYTTYHHVKIKNLSDGIVTVGPTPSLDTAGWPMLPQEELVVEVPSDKVWIVGTPDKTNIVACIVV